MNRKVDEQELLQRLAELPRAMRPRNDPWPEIAARMGEPATAARSARSRWWMPAAAAAVVLLALTAVLLPGLQRAPQESPAVVAAPPVAPAPGNTATAPPVLPPRLAASEAVYQAAFREFIPVGREQSRIPPQTLTTIESGWAELRSAEAAVAAALAASPGDPFLTGRMFELRARQLDFLRQLATLDQINRRMTT